MLMQSKGIIEFHPVDVTKKHKLQSSWKCVAIIKTDCDIDRYYAWFIKKRFNLELNQNLRRTHITFISDRMDKDIFYQGAKVFNGKEINFSYDISPRTNSKYWWLKINCEEAESIRQALGLQPHPYFGFHLTLGHANEKNIEHSKYIKRMYEIYDLRDII